MKQGFKEINIVFYIIIYIYIIYNVFTFINKKIQKIRGDIAEHISELWNKWFIFVSSLTRIYIFPFRVYIQFEEVVQFRNEWLKEALPPAFTRHAHISRDIGRDLWHLDKRKTLFYNILQCPFSHPNAGRDCSLHIISSLLL